MASIVSKRIPFGENIYKFIFQENGVLEGDYNLLWIPSGDWMDIVVFVFVVGSWLVVILRLVLVVLRERRVDFLWPSVPIRSAKLALM